MTSNTSRRTALVLAGLVLLCSPGVGAAGLEDEVLAAHDRRLAATVGEDTAALDALMTDDYSYTHSSGVTETKAEFLEALRSGKYDYTSITLDARRVRVHGETAVVSGNCEVNVLSGGKSLNVRVVFTELFVRQKGSWRSALWHSTRLPAQ